MQYDGNVQHRLDFCLLISALVQPKGREGKGREGKGREGKGREGKGREGKGREGKGRQGLVQSVSLWILSIPGSPTVFSDQIESTLGSIIPNASYTPDDRARIDPRPHL